MAEEWIEWNGGDQPVPERTWVEIDYRENYGTHHLLLADLVSWEHDPADACADVVRYRARPDIAEIQRLRKEGE